MTNGLDRTPISWAANCMLEVLATNNTVQGGFANYHNAWETETTDRGQKYIAERQARGYANSGSMYYNAGTGGVVTTASQKNGSGSIQTEYYSDGSEVHTYYDENGDATAVAYRSADYAQHMASGGTLGNYTSNTITNHNDYAIILNDKEGGHAQGHNALLIGNDAHGYLYLSKDGAANGSSGTPLKSIIPYKNLKEFMNDPRQKNYDRFLFFSVSHKLGQNIKEDMVQEIKSPYNPFTNNCGQAIENVFEKNNIISVPYNVSPNFSYDYIQSHTNGYPVER